MIKLLELLDKKVTFTSKYDDNSKLKGKQTKLPDELQAKLVKEDHEVSMAQTSLKSIISSASQLMNKLGIVERDIPGWIQDHITNAENYIDQAAQGFHELENEDQINESIVINIPENTSYQEFAKEVANILKNDYGKHNFKPFIDILIAELKNNE